jgi:hypothetical protein
MKFHLYCYEAMSGLKINYQTSGIFILGVDRTEQQRVANMFNCESGSSPMKSLGIPVSNRKVLASDFEFWRIKSQKILANCQQVPSGGRSALIDP